MILIVRRVKIHFGNPIHNKKGNKSTVIRVSLGIVIQVPGEVLVR